MAQLSKTEFIKILAEAQDMHKLVNDLQKVMSESNYQNDFFNIDIIINYEQEATLIDVLTCMFDDDSRWIEYWFTELDCGLGSWLDVDANTAVTDRDGNFIPLKTPEDVWNIIHFDKEN